MTSPVEPECVIARATSPARSCTALVTARCGSRVGVGYEADAEQLLGEVLGDQGGGADAVDVGAAGGRPRAATAAPSWTVSSPAAVSARVCCSS
ncbi:hypothetical protein SMICM17S_13259 [Streptomyces microflavus]